MTCTLSDDEIKDFSNWLTTKGADGGADCELAACVRATGMWHGFKRLIFHWTIVTGEIGDRESMSDRWCYETEDGVVAGFTEWAARGFKGEPEGWHRNPTTGRRRPKGDASKEYIAW